MLEANLKAIKCFRHSANKPVLDFPIADSVLKGLLITKEAKALFHLGLEPKWFRDYFTILLMNFDIIVIWT